MVSLPLDLTFIKYNKNLVVNSADNNNNNNKKKWYPYVDSNKLFSYNGTHRQKYVPESMTILIISAVTDKASNLSYLIMSGCTIPCFIYFLIILLIGKGMIVLSSINATVATI